MSINKLGYKYKPEDKWLDITIKDIINKVNELIGSSYDSTDSDALFDDKADSSITISATSPLTGGGDLTANRTISLTGLSDLGSDNYLIGVNSNKTGLEYKSLLGTTKQLTVTHAKESITLSTPQDTDTDADVIFDTCTLDNNGLHLLDTNASHDLIISPGSNLTADRVFTLTTGDAARTLSVEADSIINQDLSSDAQPTFAGLISTSHIDPTGAALQIRFLGTAGGGNEGILYKDSGETARYGLFFPGSDVVALGNRAANGTVELRANTSTAGSGGEVTVVTVEDDNVTFGQTFTGVTGSTIGNLTLANGSITDSGGSISFGNENLSTTGSLVVDTTTLVVNASGYADKVGIGTATPGTTLHVRNAATCNLKIEAYADNANIDLYCGTDGGGAEECTFRFHDNATSKWKVGKDAGHNFIVNDQIANTNVILVQSEGNMRLSPDGGNVGIGTITFGTNADNVFAVYNGTAPTTSPADCFQMYSADIGAAAGKAGVHFRDEEGNIVSIGSGGILMSGTARVYKELIIGAGDFKKGVSAPDDVYLSNGAHVLAFDKTTVEHGYWERIIPFDFAAGTTIDVEVAWAFDTVEADHYATWVMEYATLAVGEDPATAMTRTYQKSVISTGNNDKIIRTTFGTGITSATADDVIMVKFFRDSDATYDTDDLNQDAWLLAIHLHYISDKLGEAM